MNGDLYRKISACLMATMRKEGQAVSSEMLVLKSLNSEYFELSSDLGTSQ